MKRIVLCFVFLLLFCSFVCSVNLDHFGKNRGLTNDGSYYLSIYDENENNGLIFVFSPASDGNEEYLARMVVVENRGFSLMAPEGLILENTSKYTDFVITLYDMVSKNIILANYRSDYETGMDMLILKHEYDGTEAFVDTIMESLFTDKMLVLAVSALDISKEELDVGTTKTLMYNVVIDQEQMEDAYLDYIIWLYLMSGWQI